MVRYERRRICRGPFEVRSNTSQYLLNIYGILSDVDEAISNHIAKEGHWRPSWQDMLSSPSAIAGPCTSSSSIGSAKDAGAERTKKGDIARISRWVAEGGVV